MSLADVASAVNKAVQELNIALEAQNRNLFEEAKQRVWYASSEVEHALFLLEIALGQQLPDNSRPKHVRGGRVTLIENAAKAQSLLVEAERHLSSGDDVKAASEKIWTAQGYLIALQEKISR